MATQWHYRRTDRELGPVGFHELVNLVRAEQLSVDDLVREEWNPEWRPAALAVGLFHMAGRQDLVDRWEEEQEELRRQAEEAARLTAAEAEQVEETAWERRLRELAEERAEHEAAEREEREAELAANTTRTEIDETLAAALSEIEEREKARQPTRWQRLCRVVVSSETARLLVRWLPTMAIPNLVAWWILRWSDFQLQRFPSREALARSDRPFPGLGECEPSMYFFLLFDAMLVSGVAAYFAATILERHTEG